MKTRYGELCDTIFYQGMISSQVQLLKYVGPQKIRATTGEMMWCTGRNALRPINVIYKIYIGKEIADVNLQPFSTYTAMLNPISWLGAAVSWASNRLNGFKFLPAENPTPKSVVFHAPVLSEISVGQQTDIESHVKKYQRWLQKEDKTDGLILYGVSRGTAATFCAFAEKKYPEVKLVILEGAIDSIANVLSVRTRRCCSSEFLAGKLLGLINSGLSFFTAYNPDGLSPLGCVTEYPENVPTVFITSKSDAEVPCENTERIARALAERGRNEVYLLKLDHSSHPNYMFDDKDDRDKYEAFVHAVYQKYGLQHDPELAESGEGILAESALFDMGQKNKNINL